MYLQRAGVAGSLVLHLILTSSLSVGLNGFILIGSIRWTTHATPVTKRSGFDVQIASKVSIREDTVKIGWYREKQRPFLPVYSAKRQFIRRDLVFFFLRKRGGAPHKLIYLTMVVEIMYLATKFYKSLLCSHHLYWNSLFLSHLLKDTAAS